MCRRVLPPIAVIPVERESNFTHLEFAHALRVTDTDKESVPVIKNGDENIKNMENW